MSYFRKYMPYCIRSLGNNKWVFLNRDYAHIGTFQHTDFDNVAIKLIIPDNIKKQLSIKDDYDYRYDIYLYNDGTNPARSEEHMNNYLNRLKILSKLKDY